ncbi:hypothetical protein [Flaviaesturariibacter terrae]
MKQHAPTPLAFRKPVELLEVWRCALLYRKGERPFSDRKAPIDWTPFGSPVGAVHTDGLHLAKNVAAEIDTRVTQLLLLVSDHPGGNHGFHYPAGYAAQSGPHPVSIDQLRIDPRGEWPVTFSEAGWHDPQRASFRIATLRPGEAVEIRVNEKHDGYHQRMYIEYAWILRRSGPFGSALPEEGPFPVAPPADRRLVDLRKLLW